jgi:hypothetical protein
LKRIEPPRRQGRQGNTEPGFSGSVSELISSSYLGALAHLAVQFFSQFKIANEESMPQWNFQLKRKRFNHEVTKARSRFWSVFACQRIGID